MQGMGEGRREWREEEISEGLLFRAVNSRRIFLEF